jgi:hypothetical protein
MQLEQVSPESRDEIIAFLREVFREPATARFLAPDIVEWKCFTPRPDWPGSRAYAYRHDGRIAAFGCVVPIVVAFPDADHRLITVVDWAADGRVRGSGTELIYALTSLADARLAYGGSSSARAIAASSTRLRPFGDYACAQRVVRVGRQYAAAESQPGRAGLRWVRNVTRNIIAPVGAARGWTARPVVAFDESLPDSAHAAPRRDFLLPVRTPALLNFMLACPGAVTRGYVLEYEEQARGHLLLFGAADSVRLADLQIAGASDADWVAGFALALRLARRAFPDAVVADAMVFPGALKAAAARAGFDDVSLDPCRADDPAKLLDGAPPIAVGMIDNDAAWL